MCPDTGVSLVEPESLKAIHEFKSGPVTMVEDTINQV